MYMQTKNKTKETIQDVKAKIYNQVYKKFGTKEIKKDIYIVARMRKRV